MTSPMRCSRRCSAPCAAPRSRWKALGAAGSFVATNTRISQSVPHLHIHVVPRNKGDGLFSTRLIWQRKKYETDSDMADIATKIRAAYELAR